MRRLALLVVLLLFPSIAAAHPVPFSYLDLRLDGAATTGTLTVHVFDAAHDLGIDPPERLLDPAVASARAPALIGMLRQRLSLTAGGTPLQIAWGPVEVRPDKQSLGLPFRAGPDRGALAVAATLFPYDPRHQTFVNVYERDA